MLAALRLQCGLCATSHTTLDPPPPDRPPVGCHEHLRAHSEASRAARPTVVVLSKRCAVTHSRSLVKPITASKKSLTDADTNLLNWLWSLHQTLAKPSCLLVIAWLVPCQAASSSSKPRLKPRAPALRKGFVRKPRSAYPAWTNCLSELWDVMGHVAQHKV